MLSNKMTFSLTCFVVLIAFGLVCLAPPAFGDGATGGIVETVYHDFDVKITAGESMIDVDATDHSDIDDIQIATGRDRASRVFTAGDSLIITLLVEFTQTVQLHAPEVIADDEPNPEVELMSGPDFGEDDILIQAFDVEGRPLGTLTLAHVATDDESILGFRDATAPGRQFLVRIDEEKLAAAYQTELRAPTGAGFEIYTLMFLINQHSVRKADLAHAHAHVDTNPDTATTNPTNHTNAHSHWNKVSNPYRVDLVDDDQGDPQYAKLTSSSTAMDVAASGGALNAAGDNADAIAGTGTPGVVSIMRVIDRSGYVETAPFDVRIILTEDPKGGLTMDNIMVANGTVTSVARGLTYRGGHNEIEVAERTVGEGDAEVTLPAYTIPQRISALGPAMVDYYHTADDADAAEDVAIVVEGAAADNGTVVNFPEATGRDNMYHSYVATITPNADVNGMVTVSIGTFEDNVMPVSKRYVPLTREQRLATTLSGAAMYVRNARVMNESLSVRVSTAKHQDRLDLMAEWKKRRDLVDDPRTGLFNLSPHVREIVSGDHRDLGGFAKLIIPADGYLVLTRGSGIVNSPGALKLKLTEEQEKYNIIGFAPPRPASNLETFFRNGGTLHLLHSDLPLSTTAKNVDGDQIIGPSHTKGDAGEKEADTDHKDYTGYDGADSTAYTAGSVIVSEVMWGLDYISVASQYIELYNPGTEAIELDPLEWVIVAGSVPSNLSDFTVIDTIGNNPSSGYWQVPGSSGVTGAIGAAELAEGQPIPVVARGDLVSMSRVTDGAGLAADGTAQASWATSMRPSANLSGRRIGTPGAANIYEPATVEEEDEEDEAPMADAATAADIMITEIMVASNDGRLPQWIELANVSGAAVSLSGWSLVIDNDSADADVVGGSVDIDLGDVEIGADQVALVISKESARNSGVGDGEGDLRADRIIDVQSDVSPDNARYTLISEMGFMISLMPPQTGAVRMYGDVVGNLDGGWDLPMSEGGRSSLIRREMNDTGEIMGTDAAGWVLASDTTLGGAYRTTYYGSDEDVGTPGYDAGGALPVELSKFGAKRDPLTGAVMITWETQSELNNAGFYIKRSQQKDGKFVVVNPTMIAGAGTTAEKQSYTYTDATADPNVIYYYQIEDVSLDGNRQTLTRAHRLKGHIGAAGKATTTWGDLKSSRD